MFYVLRVNVYCHRVPTQLQLTNISISISVSTSHALTECRGKNLPYHYGVHTGPGTYPELIGRKKALRVRVNGVMEELRWSTSDNMSLKV
jgi:hypothetical protein